MKLHLSYRSSAAARVRIAMGLKGIDFEPVEVKRGKSSGEIFDQSYQEINPQGLVPALEDQGHLITQSVAILDYLEMVSPEPSLLPSDPQEVARVRALMYIVVCDVHPLENEGTLNYLRRLGLDEQIVVDWYNNWILKGLGAIEKLVSQDAGVFCFGDRPTLADVCLVPQVYNAFRHTKDPLKELPNITRIYNAALEIPAFSNGLPDGRIVAV